MNFACSNIAWTPHDDPGALSLLKEQGIAGIEVAPTRVWPEWQGATPASAERYRCRLLDSGFEVPALQAVLFGRPDASLFDPAGVPRFVSHLTRVAQLAGALGAAAVVLGAPRQRDRGALSQTEALNKASEVLYRLAEVYAAYGTCLCIEPNPRRYSCNFIVNAAEGAGLVRLVGHRGFGLHLDAAAMFLEGDELPEIWPRAGHLVRHFHISEPDLGDFRNPEVPHQRNLTFLASTGYMGWCSVEMRAQEIPLSIAGPWQILRGIG